MGPSMAALEMLDLWAREEAMALQRMQADRPILVPAVRAAALDLVRQTIALGAAEAARSVAGAEAPVHGADWFQAARFLDSGAGMREASPKKVLSRALASWSLSLKLATNQVRQLKPLTQRRIVACASKISDHFGDEEVTWEDVLVEERCLLTCATFSNSSQTLMCWISAYLRRFFELAADLSERPSDNVLCLAEWYAFAIVRGTQYGAGAPPQRVALGICGAALAALGLMLADDLRPPEETADDWNVTMAGMATAVYGDAAAAWMASDVLVDALPTLEAATQRQAAELRDAAREVVEMVRGWHLLQEV